jgi:hypothetical protein
MGVMGFFDPKQIANRGMGLNRLFCLDFSIPNADLDMLSLHFSAWRVFTFMNEPFSQEQSPLTPLITAVQQSPFAIAPERQDELKSLIDQYSITAVLKFGGLVERWIDLRKSIQLKS